MPCSECGHLLLAFYPTEKFLCPRCLDISLENQEIIEEKAERDRELLRDENIVQLMEEYDKGHLLLYLMHRLNHASYQLIEERGFPMTQFAYLNYIIKIIYPEPEDKFGDKYLEQGDELDEEMRTLLSTQSELVPGLNHVEDQFRFCVQYPFPMPESKFLFGEYALYDSEYRNCLHRNLRSLIGGSKEYLVLFDKTHQEFRDFGVDRSGDPESLEEFAKRSFEFVISLLFIASADEIVSDIYYTSLPDHVTVLDIREFLNRIDAEFSEDDVVLLQDDRLGWTNEKGLNSAGEEVFGDDWPEVRESIVVSQDNLSAHPFLFEINYELPIKEVPGRPPITVQKTRIVYPRYYSRILQYQIFPILENGDESSGHDLLKQVSTERGPLFERNVFEYLTGQGFECFHSAQISKNYREEIDVLAVNDDEEELWFLECKYLLPETNMSRSEGIERLNETFDYKVFKEEGAYSSLPTGDPFPEKVDSWLDLEGGDEFTSLNSDPDGDRVTHEFDEDWTDYDHRMFVVSNLTPSYVEKQGVEFLTDMEFMELLEGDESVFEKRY